MFITNVLEVNAILEDRIRFKDEEDPNTKDQIDKNLPREYSAFRDVFSKTKSNKLPSNRSYDYII